MIVQGCFLSGLWHHKNIPWRYSITKKPKSQTGRKKQDDKKCCTASPNMTRKKAYRKNLYQGESLKNGLESKEK